jgi:hypothetical protein
MITPAILRRAGRGDPSPERWSADGGNPLQFEGIFLIKKGPEKARRHEPGVFEAGDLLLDPETRHAEIHQAPDVEEMPERKVSASRRLGWDPLQLGLSGTRTDDHRTRRPAPRDIPGAR